METNSATIEEIVKLKNICRKLVNNSKDVQPLEEIESLIYKIPDKFINIIQPMILSAFYPILKNISDDKASYRNKEKQAIVKILKILFSKCTIKNTSLFFNIYSFLLFELYDHFQHKVLPISEEYKLTILECTKYLSKSLSSDLIFEVYSKENAPKLCQMVYVAIEIAKTEKMRQLRIAAMECIMSLARILDDNEFGDVVVRKHVAQVFLFFLPGLASGFKQIALEDEKVGHKIPQVAIKAWARIITLLVQDYNPADNKFDIDFLKTKINEDIQKMTPNNLKRKFKDNEELKEYLQNTKRGPEWYKETDKRLQPFAVEFMKLTNHSRREVRIELSIMCQVIIDNCLTTIPRTVCNLIEIIIAMSENEDDEIASINQKVLDELSNKLSSDAFPVLLETLEDGFLNGINRLPRQFNSVDDREQCSSLNLIIGYLSLFGKYKLSHVLLTGNHLKKLLDTLIHLSKLEVRSNSTIEEISSNDLDISHDKTVWKNFHFIRNDSVQNRLEKLCGLLGKYGTFKMVSDFLLDVLLYQPEDRKEVIFVLNEVISGHSYCEETDIIIKEILNVYTDDCYWNVPLTVSADEFGHQYSLNEVHSNAIQICLLVEGIGKIALLMKKRFEKFTLKLLYMILEKAGQNYSLVRAASLFALKNITISCGYQDVQKLINDNMDFFSFHIERKLQKHDNIKNVLNVLSIVLRYSSVNVLTPISYILKEVLVQSCDQFKQAYATEYLKVFKTFIQCVWRWYDIKVNLVPIKSRAIQIEEIEPFKVTGVKAEENLDFSDDIMGKSAEELFNEDMEKKKDDLKKEYEEPEVEEYKKPDPPMHISITVAILKTSLHFLPSKDKNRKLLVLEILNGGLEVIKDWEDELLPIVHQIWSPLVGRFKEYQDPLIINYSFQLLMSLARHSKEFIRIRTIKEVLPSIVQSLQMFSTESYLKDKGSAFRYSQGYKLQLRILEELGKLMAYLNVQEEPLMQVSEAVFRYLSDKQPVPLQESALIFFSDIGAFDENFITNQMKKWLKEHENDEFVKNLRLLSHKLKENCVT